MDMFNRQLHPDEKTLAKRLAAKAGRTLVFRIIASAISGSSGHTYCYVTRLMPWIG